LKKKNCIDEDLIDLLATTQFRALYINMLQSRYRIIQVYLFIISVEIVRLRVRSRKGEK